MSYEHLRSILKQSVDNSINSKKIFFKTAKGQYSEHDNFIPITVPTLRKIAKNFITLSLSDCSLLLSSLINEERLLALLIIINKFKLASEKEKITLYNFYLQHLDRINNWNLVDTSAHLIIGSYLLNSADKNILFSLAKSNNIWERRISIVSTLFFIRNNYLDSSFKIAALLLKDSEDLIHKAVGWILREAGKKDELLLHSFLEQNIINMPRTMLRYAIEKFSPEKRKYYLAKKTAPK